MASVSEPGLLCTNGMSNSRHCSPFANAAIVTTLGPREFGPGAFDGRRAPGAARASFFEAGGSGLHRAGSVRAGLPRGSREREPGRSSYRFGTIPGRIDALLPEPVRDALAHALLRFER